METVKKIGLLLVCTNKYFEFLPSLINSSEEFFMKNHDVTYFVYTDQIHYPIIKNDLSQKIKRNIVPIEIEHKPWPWMTLGRYKMFSDSFELLKEMDYLYYCDVDMLFVDEIGDEILSDRIGVLHSSFIGNCGSPERNPQSTACIDFNIRNSYFAGGFNGGKSELFLEMSEKIKQNIEIDFSKNIIAVWHDESHLNKYYSENPPTLILNPTYCYPEQLELPYPKKLLALDKRLHNPKGYEYYRF